MKCIRNKAENRVLAIAAANNPFKYRGYYYDKEGINLTAMSIY